MVSNCLAAASGDRTSSLGVFSQGLAQVLLNLSQLWMLLRRFASSLRLHFNFDLSWWRSSDNLLLSSSFRPRVPCPGGVAWPQEDGRCRDPDSMLSNYQEHIDWRRFSGTSYQASAPLSFPRDFQCILETPLQRSARQLLWCLPILDMERTWNFQVQTLYHRSPFCMRNGWYILWIDDDDTEAACWFPQDSPSSPSNPYSCISQSIVAQDSHIPWALVQPYPPWL